MYGQICRGCLVIRQCSMFTIGLAPWDTAIACANCTEAGAPFDCCTIIVDDICYFGVWMRPWMAPDRCTLFRHVCLVIWYSVDQWFVQKEMRAILLRAATIYIQVSLQQGSIVISCVLHAAFTCLLVLSGMPAAV